MAVELGHSHSRGELEALVQYPGWTTISIAATLVKMINMSCFMETLNATDAKREFGEVLLKVQSAPIGINRNGKPVAVVISASDYTELNAMRNEWLKAELQKGMDSLRSGRVTDGEVVINRLRKRLENASL